jgi:hypothetical protein
VDGGVGSPPDANFTMVEPKGSLNVSGFLAHGLCQTCGKARETNTGATFIPTSAEEMLVPFGPLLSTHTPMECFSAIPRLANLTRLQFF